MRHFIQTSHHRWIVVFSVLAMFCCAVGAGVSREVLERLKPEFMTDILPGGPFRYATLGVIALLFLLGMAGNAGLILYPSDKPIGKISLWIGVVVLLILLLVAGGYGFRLFALLARSTSVGAG